MEILSFIPARSGSKRIPNKNIKKLNGKPLICYTIEASLNSKLSNRTVVSTDSQKIASVSRQFGAETPFLRPKAISGTNSTEMEFFEHALTWFKENENWEPDLIVLLYPTSPFRKSCTIDKAIEKIKQHKNADSLRSIKKCAEHPYKMWKINNDLLKPFVNSAKKNMHTLSYQLLPEVYIQNASIYITKPSTIWQKKSPTGDIIIPFIMAEIESVDVNNQIDFDFAEFLLKNNLQNF